MMVVAVARRGLRCSSCTKRIYSAAAAMGFLMGLVRERERSSRALVRLPLCNTERPLP